MQVHAISSPGPELEVFGEQQKVPVSAVSMPRRITPFVDLQAVAALIREMRRIRPLIVHAHTPKGGLLGMIAATAYRAPVRIYHMRGLPLMGAAGWKRKLLVTTEKLACRLAHRVLCVSHSVRKEAVDAGLCPPDKIHVLLGGSGNGVDADDRFNPERPHLEPRDEVRARLGIPLDALVIGFVGRLVRDKGIVELAAAWKELREQYPSLHLLLVGPFEEQDPVPRETERLLRDDDRVHLVGADWNTPPLYGAMDVVTLPTYREGFPNVPLEASAMCLPIVATRVSGCVDAVLDERAGILVPPKDAAALQRALIRYLSDEDLRKRHGSAGRERVLREFRQAEIWEAIHGTYIELLEKQGLLVPVPSVEGEPIR